MTSKWIEQASERASEWESERSEERKEAHEWGRENGRAVRANDEADKRVVKSAWRPFHTISSADALVKTFFFLVKKLPILETWIRVPEIYLPPKAFYIGPSLLVPHKYRNRKRFEIKSLHRKRFTALAQWFKTVWNRKYWDTRSSARLFACTAHSFACSALLALLTRSAAFIRSFARSVTRSWARVRVEYFCPIFKVS